MAKAGKSQFAILGMLALLKKSSGYDLKKHMEASTQYFWKETFSSIYPVLEDLEEQKLIIKAEQTRKNSRQRNAYTLTQEGQKVLENWLIQPAEDMQVRNELMLKLFFGNLVPVQVSIKHLEKQKKDLKNKLALYRNIRDELSVLSAAESLYPLLTLDHGIRQVLATVEWCDSAIKVLKSVKH